MKTSYYYIAGAALIGFLLYRRKQKIATGTTDPQAPGAKGVSKVDEAIPTGGTNFTGDIMSALNGSNATSPNHANLLPGANADGGGHTAQTLGLSVGWDGTLA